MNHGLHRRVLVDLLFAILGAAVAVGPAGPAAAQVPLWSLQAQARLRAGPDAGPQAVQERQRLVQAGERFLDQGESQAAADAFDQAALIVHSADVEAGLVRSYMQAGEYRRALSFAAHTAGAHRDVPEATALYAWLLQMGGQGRVAAHMLQEALARTPDNAALVATRAQLAAPWPRPATALMAAPMRAAPQSWGGPVSEAGRVVGTATLLRGGVEAWVPEAVVRGASRLWVRNGLGQVAPASVVAGLAPEGWRRLRLATPLPEPNQLASAGRSPFAGSPAYMIEFGADEEALPAWPVLRQGFFGRMPLQGERALGVDAPPGPRGGPVFDAMGRIVGVAGRGADGQDLLISVYPTELAAVGAPTGERVAADVVYETSLRIALQVLVLR